MWVWDAFWDLGTERQVGMGTGPIPYRAIRQWADDYDVRPAEVFVRWIRRMDTQFLTSLRSTKDKGQTRALGPNKGDSAHADRSTTPRS